MTPRRILVAGWLVFLLYAYPGYLLGDAADQLLDSRSGSFTDWHSPMMTEVWRIVGRVIGGPPGMLFLQSLLLLGGTFVVLRRAMSERAAAIAAVCVLVFPPLIATTALISAEAQLASFLIAATAALATPRLRWLGLALMIIACGMHDGAALAALPIIVATFRWNDRARWRVAVAIAAWVAVVVAAAGIDRVLVDSRSERNEVALATADIVGTLHDANDIADAELQHVLGGVPLASSTEIQRHARANDRVLDPPTTPEQRDALFAARRALVRAAPTAYLEHRWHVFCRALGLWSKWWPLHTDFVASPDDRVVLRYAARHSLVQSWLLRPVQALSRTFLFRPHFYLILAIILLPFAVFRRAHDATMLLTSGMLYELSLVFETNRAEYRDSHWMIVATVLAIIVLVARMTGDVRSGTRSRTQKSAARRTTRT